MYNGLRIKPLLAVNYSVDKEIHCEKRVWDYVKRHNWSNGLLQFLSLTKASFEQKKIILNSITVYFRFDYLCWA